VPEAASRMTAAAAAWLAALTGTQREKANTMELGDFSSVCR